MFISPKSLQKNTARMIVVFFLFLFFLSAQVSFAQEAVVEELEDVVGAEENIVVNEYQIKKEFIGDPEEGAQGDFVVGPGKTELIISPGEQRVVEVLITNRTGEERLFNIITEDAAGSNDPDVPVLLLGNQRGPYTLKDYLVFPEKQILLANNERARVPVVVSVPPDAEPGGLYGSVIVTTASKGQEEDEVTGAAPRSAVISRIGSLFFVTVPGDIDISGELKNFDTLPPKHFFWKGPIRFQLLYHNTGSLHLNPYGEIHITNMLGEEVGFVELDPWFALPQSLRAREIEWTRELLIGRYTATANINRGYDDIIDTQSIVFWVVPWKLIALVFGMLFFIFFSFRFLIKNFEFKRKV